MPKYGTYRCTSVRYERQRKWIECVYVLRGQRFLARFLAEDKDVDEFLNRWVRIGNILGLSMC